MKNNELKMGKIKELTKEDLESIAGGLIVDCRSMANDIGGNFQISGIKNFLIVDEKSAKVIGVAKDLYGESRSFNHEPPEEGYTYVPDYIKNSAIWKELVNKCQIVDSGSKFSDTFTVVGNDIYYKPLLKK